jgi:phosphoserine phosphatase
VIGLGLGLGRPRYGTVVFDVDSTVAAIEGIDWLAALRGPAVEHACATLTARAMAGELPLEAVYAERLAVIGPTHAELDDLSLAYVEAVQPGAAEIIVALHDAGVAVHLLSGGLRYALLPLARELGIAADRVHAVNVLPDLGGRFVQLNGEQPLATQRGKPLVLSQLMASPAFTRPVVMIGDGSTDAATRGVVDQFIAYTGVARRDAVVAVADAEAKDFLALLPLLFKVPA